MSGRYSPTRAQPQTIDDLRRWVQSELDRISVALSQNEVIYGPLDPDDRRIGLIGTLYHDGTKRRLFSEDRRG